MRIKVTQRGGTPSVELGSLGDGQGFVRVDTGRLYVRVRGRGGASSGECRCIRLTPPEDIGISYLYTYEQVRPADINIEWSTG